jgi:hypothetical protein
MELGVSGGKKEVFAGVQTRGGQFDAGTPRLDE